MHGYYDKPSRLKEKLAEFVGGQFLLETKIGDKRGLVLRGEIIRFDIPDLTQRRVLIYFGRLWEQRFGVTELFRPVSKWILHEPPLTAQFVEVHWRWYYFQRKRVGEKGKEDREERIRIKTDQKEDLHIYKIGDPTNIIDKEGSFLPNYEPTKPISD